MNRTKNSKPRASQRDRVTGWCEKVNVRKITQIELTAGSVVCGARDEAPESQQQGPPRVVDSTQPTHGAERVSDPGLSYRCLQQAMSRAKLLS